ncbi:MAG TPA: membrane protein insertase YidC [Candidatus Binatia bacterium]
MDKRAILGIALSILVLVIYQDLVTRFYPPPTQSPAPTNEKNDTKAVETTEIPAEAKDAAAVADVRTAPAKVPAGQPARDIKVETENYAAVFTNRGARLKSFKFKKYRVSADENSPPVEMVQTAPGVPLPLGVRWQAPQPFEDSDLIYSVQGGDLMLRGDAKANLQFQGQNSNGVVITKSFTFSGSSYPIQMEVSAKAPDGTARIPEILITEKADHSKANHDAPFEGFIALVDNKIKREAPDESDNGLEFTGEVSWAGFGHTYFFFGLVPENGAGHKLTVRQDGTALVLATSAPSPAERATLFIGPKELETLKAVGKGLERAIDFGYFGFVSIPFLYLLHFFHSFTGSYGLDIILLTVLIKILMAPLTHKSFVSMKAMQKLQPQMEKLKEKYGNDKEKLNKEIMELYRRNGVNPLGGCLPMVLQFPVFIGLYNALSTPIELRHASFLWIKDLSRPDWESLPIAIAGWQFGIPVLTILMGASMFIQQWMTPTAGDPNQRKIMMLMPLMFTFMFVSFPAGLTVYWLVNNLLTIVQQYWINRHYH